MSNSINKMTLPFFLKLVYFMNDSEEGFSFLFKVGLDMSLDTILYRALAR